MDRNTPAWRAEALSLLFAHLPLPSDDATVAPNDSPHSISIPRLTELCLRVSLASYPVEDLALCLPLHLRRVLLRYTAVRSPLTSAELLAVCEPELGGHADGELIVVGPQAMLPVGYFKAVLDDPEDTGPSGSGSGSGGHEDELEEGTGEEEEDESDTGSWDSTSSPQDDPPPLLSLTILSPTSTISLSLLRSLPPTLTHLALLALPSLTPIHRLPRLLPLLEVLDLSYNVWLSLSKVFKGGGGAGGGYWGKRGENLLERTEWGRWTRLRVLGLRKCGVKRGVVARVNRGRWVDVEVIGVT